jgi:ubiquinone biosynthesis protein UbiJ
MTVLEHIKQLAMNLTPDEKEALAEYLGEANGEKPSEKPQSLRGIGAVLSRKLSTLTQS